jgi:hypothetical protein
MKAVSTIPLMGVLLLGSVLNAALPDPVTYQSPKAEIIFQHPDNYTDIKDAFTPTEKGEKGYLDILGNYIVELANHLIPDGDKLTMVFTDVDLAGDFEPWRGAQADDIRIIKDIYPPDYKFTWKVTNPAGQVVKQGNEDYRDIDFQMNFSIDDSTPLKQDKAEFQSWMHEHLRHLSKP